MSEKKRTYSPDDPEVIEWLQHELEGHERLLEIEAGKALTSEYNQYLSRIGDAQVTTQGNLEEVRKIKLEVQGLARQSNWGGI